MDKRKPEMIAKLKPLEKRGSETSGKALFACSKCFSRHPFEDLSAGQQLCKNCSGTSTLTKCVYCRSEFFPAPSSKLQATCRKCEYSLGKFGKPKACECCKVVAAFGATKCQRCASYESKYGAPVQCDECKQRSAFDKRDENKKFNGKLLCWLCSCAFQRALVKAQEDVRYTKGKRVHDLTGASSGNQRSYSLGFGGNVDINPISGSKKKRGTYSEALMKHKEKGFILNTSGSKLPRSMSTTISGLNSTSGTTSIQHGGTNTNMPQNSMPAPAAVINMDPNSADHVVAVTTLKEVIAGLEKRLQMKNRELLDKDKLLTELRCENFEKENAMRTKIKEMDRLNEMKVENLNRKISSLLKEVATLKKGNKKNAKYKREEGSPLFEERLFLEYEKNLEDSKSGSSSRSITPHAP